MLDPTKIAYIYNYAFDVQWNLTGKAQDSVTAGVAAVAKWAYEEGQKDAAQ